MQIIKEIDNDNQMSPLACVLDIQRLDKLNRPEYSAAQEQLSGILLDLVRTVYTSSSVYRNYRKKFIVIKVDEPKTADRVRNDTTALDTFCQEHNVSPVFTPKSILFRLAKQ
jgi:hypothetical protein